MRPLLLSIFFCTFYGCADERIVNVPGEAQVIYIESSPLSLEFNIYARLLYDNNGYYVTWWGDVKNTGSDTLKNVFPQGKIFFSSEAMQNDNPAVVSQGNIGLFNEAGGFEIKTALPPKEVFRHFTESERFFIPDNAQYVNYLFRFIQINGNAKNASVGVVSGRFDFWAGS